MRIGLSLFIGMALSGWIILAFFLECLSGNRLIKASKDVRFKKTKCEVCASAYFVSVLFEFWRCPLCGSVNRERSGKR